MRGHQEPRGLIALQDGNESLVYLGGREGNNLDLISRDDLGNEVRLIDDKASGKFLDASLAGLDSLLESHVLSVVLVKN